MVRISFERAAIAACVLGTKICFAFSPNPSALFSCRQSNLSDFKFSRKLRTKGKYNDEIYGPSLAQKIADLRKCITPVLGREIEYYEFITRYETDNVDAEYGNFFIGFKDYELVLCINWEYYEPAYVGLWSRQEVDAYFAKEAVYDCFKLSDGTFDEFSKNRTTYTENSQESIGIPRFIGYVDIIGSKIIGVYLGNDETTEKRWTELFLDLGHFGCLNIQAASGPSGWPFFTELEDSLESLLKNYDSHVRIVKVLPIFE